MEQPINPENLQKLASLENTEQCIKIFKDSFELLKETKELPNPQSQLGKLVFKIISIFRQIQQKKYSVVNEIKISELEEQRSEIDFFTSLLINYHFLCNKKMHKIDFNLYFHLLTLHREYKNKECTSVLTNICLKISIILKRYFLLNNEVEIRHKGLYHYYQGFILLKLGKFHQSFIEFKHSSILLNSIKTDKCLIVNALLLNEPFNILNNRKIKKYLELKYVVESGDLEKYNLTLQKNQQVYENDDLFDEIKKIEQNVRIQQFMKMSKVYSRISRDDLIRFGIDASLLDNSSVIHFNKSILPPHDINCRIEECKEVISKAKELMQYNEIEPVSYDNSVANKN